jgi:hypothetical protein
VRRFLRAKGTPAILEEYHSIRFSVAAGFLRKRTPLEFLSVDSEWGWIEFIVIKNLGC